MTTHELASQQALHSLYLAHRDWLVALLRRKLGGNVEQAADLAHDTFERVMRRDLAPALNEPRAYLTTVAQRLVVSHYRRSALEAAYAAALAQRPEALAPSPEEQLQILEVLDEVCDMLDGLDRRSQQIFLMSQYEGMTYGAIAQQLGLSIHVVKHTMSKVLQRCYLALYA